MGPGSWVVGPGSWVLGLAYCGPLINVTRPLFFDLLYLVVVEQEEVRAGDIVSSLFECSLLYASEQGAFIFSSNSNGIVML